MRISDWSSDVCSSDLVEIEGVLCGDLAADVAVAAVHAGALRLALRIRPRLRVAVGVGIVEAVVPLGIEGHRQRQLAEARAVTERFGAFVHQLAEIGRASLRERVCQYV